MDNNNKTSVSNKKQIIHDLIHMSDHRLYFIKNKKIIFKNFEDFNIYLVNNNIKMTIKDYIECIHPHLFKHIDISILTLFLNYSKDDLLFNITESDLINFSLIDNNNNIELETFINKYKLKLDLEYRIRKINKKSNQDTNQNINTDSNKEINNKEYKFTSRVLKKCLMKLDDKYIDYYLLLENCIYHYTNYQTNLYHKLAFIKDIKLDNLIKNYEYQTDNIGTLSLSIEHIFNTNKLMYDNLNYVHEKINNITNFLEKNYISNNQNIKLRKIMYTFKLYQIDNKKLYFIDTYSEIIENIIKKINLKYNYFDLLYSIEYNAKYIDIISKVKYKFKDELSFFNSEIILNNPKLQNKDIIEYIQEEVKQFN
jgi:hypothetical protein